jgi:hypothetical protein
LDEKIFVQNILGENIGEIFTISLVFGGIIKIASVVQVPADDVY